MSLTCHTRHAAHNVEARRLILRDRAEQRGELAAVVWGRREELGLRQEELADCSPRFVHELESGKATVRLDKVLDVLSALGMHLGVATGSTPSVIASDPVRSALEVAAFDEVRFTDLLAEHDIVLDQVGIPGVQDKVSLAMLNVPVAAAESCMLKLNPPEYRHLVQNEAFFLALAPRSRVRAARARVVHDRDGESGLVVTRFDRSREGGQVRAFAMEDACHVLGVHPEAKYRRSTEDVLAALVGVCEAPLPAALEFLRQAVFAHVTGNGDAHAKNFSVLADATGRWAPAPAYDVPSSQPVGTTRWRSVSTEGMTGTSPGPDT